MKIELAVVAHKDMVGKKLRTACPVEIIQGETYAEVWEKFRERYNASDYSAYPDYLIPLADMGFPHRPPAAREPMGNGSVLPEAGVMYEIEKGVPIPKKRYSQRPELFYQFQAMEIGDSIVIPANLRNNSAYFARMADIRITTRMQKETGDVRIWRIA